MGLVRLLAGLLLLLWVMRLLRTLFATPRPGREQGASTARKTSEFNGKKVEEAEYEELP